MDIIEKMAADIAMKLNGGEWKDGKWYSKGHREAWIKAVQPYADEIERLREALLRISRYPKIPTTHEFAMSHCHEMVKLARSALQQKESE